MSDDKYKVLSSRSADPIFGPIVGAISGTEAHYERVQCPDGEVRELAVNAGQTTGEAIANGQFIDKK